MRDAIKGLIGRGTVQDEVLDAGSLGKPLPVYRSARPQNRLLCVVAGGNDGEIWSHGERHADYDSKSDGI